MFNMTKVYLEAKINIFFHISEVFSPFSENVSVL